MRRRRRKHRLIRIMLLAVIVVVGCRYIREHDIKLGDLSVGKYTLGDITIIGHSLEKSDKVLHMTDEDGLTPVDLARNGETLTQVVYPAYRTEDMHVYACRQTVEILFDCAAYVIHDDTLYIVRNECDTTSAAVIHRNGRAYYDAVQIAQSLGDTWHIDKDKECFSTEGEDCVLPAAYDYRKEGRAPAVRDQGESGTCWAASSITALESGLLPGEFERFAPDHMTLHNSFGIALEEGGNSVIAGSYLSAWQGPVPESEDPYGDGYSPDGLTAVRHVQEIHILNDPSEETVKESIYRFGGVESSFYIDMDNAWTESEYFNQEASAYCFTGGADSNHDLVVIGWDDAYPAENFSVPVQRDGAWICQNSWGPEFGEGGVFYVSYEDANLLKSGVVFAQIDTADNYAHIYQTDLCGWIGQLGYGMEDAYFANCYTAEGDEKLSAAGFYAVGPDTSYEVYAADGEMLHRRLVARGSLREAGYYTIPFARKIDVEAGEEFSVVVKIHTPESTRPVAIEFEGEDGMIPADIDDGRGFISAAGTNWISTEDEQQSNICLKVYTQDKYM